MSTTTPLENPIIVLGLSAIGLKMNALNKYEKNRLLEMKMSFKLYLICETSELKSIWRVNQKILTCLIGDLTTTKVHGFEVPLFHCRQCRVLGLHIDLIERNDRSRRMCFVPSYLA